MRVLATAIVYLLSLAPVAISAFFIAIVLAGPHSDLLPGWLGAIVLGVGWLVVLLLPAWIAYWVWRRLGFAAA